VSQNDKKWNYNLRRLHRIALWKLLTVFLLSVLLSATFLRLNNVGMIGLREAVYSADKSGDEVVIRDRIADLHAYVSTHMNTDLGNGVFLVSTYNSDYQALLDEAAKDTNKNGNIYKKAQEVCAPQFSSWSQQYVQCVAAELAKYPSSSELISSVFLPTAGYTYNFASPYWSPDFAGWSLVVSVVIFIMIITRITGVLILKAILKVRRHHV
jgi:hypothetical protein